MTTEYIVGNAIVVVRRPALTESEQAKVNQKVTMTLQQFGKAMVKANETIPTSD